MEPAGAFFRGRPGNDSCAFWCLFKSRPQRRNRFGFSLSLAKSGKKGLVSLYVSPKKGTLNKKTRMAVFSYLFSLPVLLDLSFRVYELALTFTVGFPSPPPPPGIL